MILRQARNASHPHTSFTHCIALHAPLSAYKPFADATHVSKPGGGNVTEPGVEPTSSGRMTGDRTADLKRSAVISGTGIHRLIYRDVCVAATAHDTMSLLFITQAHATRLRRRRRAILCFPRPTFIAIYTI